MTFAKKMNNKGRNIVKKYPQLFPLFRSLKILFFTKHHFSWWGSKMIEKYYIKKFSRIYFGTEGKYQRWQETTWLGISALKLPTDMWASKFFLGFCWCLITWVIGKTLYYFGIKQYGGYGA